MSRQMDNSEVRGYDHGWINLGVRGERTKQVLTGGTVNREFLMCMLLWLLIMPPLGLKLV